MARTNYQKGADKERRIVLALKSKGFLSFRSAGSHSPIDVFAINPFSKEIKLIQAKLRGKTNLSSKERSSIISEGSQLNGSYSVIFELWD